MKILLANGKELIPILVKGYTQYSDGSGRNTMEFVFDGDTSITEIDILFSEANCEKITIVDDNGDRYVHTGYVIRVSLMKTIDKVSEGSDTEAPASETRVKVTMAQRTYAEAQLASIKKTQDEQSEVIAEILFGEV